LNKVWILLGVLLAGLPVWAAPAVPSNPNVLLITLDTVRLDRISFYSDAYVRTPHIDALARKSAVFAHAFANTVLTRPSHTNILTGTTPPYHGVSDNPGFKLENRYLTLAEYLKERGYATSAFIGAFVLDSQFGLDQGFDLYDDINGIQEFGQLDYVERRADQVVEPAIAWIASQDKKWFSWIHIFDPHDPYTPPEPYAREYAFDPYSGEMAFIDAQLGRLFDALAKSGTLDRTVVILTSDHGEAFGEKEEVRHGFFAYNNTIHIPLILYIPGGGPKVVSENASHLDIFPTVCDLLGSPLPSHLQGESLLPLIDGRTRRKAEIYFESLSPHLTMASAPLRGFIQGNQKFIDLPIKEVYDLAADPKEEKNLGPTADIPRLSKTLEDLMKNLEGPGTTQDIKGKNPEIGPLLTSLGYLAGKPTKKKSYGIEDDLKTLYPLIAQVRLAIDDYREKRPEAAIKKLQTILRIRPNYVNAYAILADIHYSLAKLDLAETVLSDGLEKNPETIALASRLGIVSAMLKKYDKAIAYLEECTEKDPYHPDWFNFLGWAYMGAGKLDRAKENLQKALKISPSMDAAHNNLGYLHLTLFLKTKDRESLDEALRSFDRALAVNPGLIPAQKGREAVLGYQRQPDPPKKKGS